MNRNSYDAYTKLDNCIIHSTDAHINLLDSMLRGGSGGGMTSHPPWRGSLFHVIIMRVT